MLGPFRLIAPNLRDNTTGAVDASLLEEVFASEH